MSAAEPPHLSGIDGATPGGVSGETSMSADRETPGPDNTASERQPAKVVNPNRKPGGASVKDLIFASLLTPEQLTALHPARAVPDAER